MELTIVMEGERPLSWNQFYAGVHYKKRMVLKANKQAALLYAVSDIDLPRFHKPVAIQVIAYLKGQFIDVDNVCVKPYVDALVNLGVIQNDTPQYFNYLTVAVRRDSKKPRVELHITDGD